VVGYGYDMDGNVTSIDYPGAATVTRGYDDAGRWASVADWLGNTTTFGYAADSNLVGQVYPNATIATFNFDPAGRLEASAQASASTPSNPFASFAYTRDGNDQLASVVTAGMAPDDHTYGYDALNRLAGVDDATYAPTT
jgi:YD repeat-containing protein